MSSSVSSALGNQGASVVFEHNGKKYTVSRLTQKRKAEFEQWLQRRALAIQLAMRSLPGLGDNDDIRRAYQETVQDIATGKYSFHGAVAQSALRDSAGALALAAILFGCSEDEMLELMIQRGQDVQATLDTVFAESHVPNGQSPAQDPAKV